MQRRVLVTGDRRWTDWRVIRGALLVEQGERSPDTMTLIHGDCPTGADRIANGLATDWRWNVERYPADWYAFGRKAGPLRNTRMVERGAHVCLAFLTDQSRGTVDCADKAEAAGIEVKRFYA